MHRLVAVVAHTGAEAGAVDIVVNAAGLVQHGSVLDASDDVDLVLFDLKMEDDDGQIGVNIVRKSLEVPMRKIAENAGIGRATLYKYFKRAGWL